MGKSDQQQKQPNGNPSKEAAGSAPQPETDSSIREWFATLSIEEQARALGFSDGAILSFLIKHASLSSSASSKSGGTAESRTDKKGEINITLLLKVFAASFFPPILTIHSSKHSGCILSCLC